MAKGADQPPLSSCRSDDAVSFPGQQCHGLFFLFAGGSLFSFFSCRLGRFSRAPFVFGSLGRDRLAYPNRCSGIATDMRAPDFHPGESSRSCGDRSGGRWRGGSDVALKLGNSRSSIPTHMRTSNFHLSRGGLRSRHGLGTRRRQERACLSQHITASVLGHITKISLTIRATLRLQRNSRLTLRTDQYQPHRNSPFMQG